MVLLYCVEQPIILLEVQYVDCLLLSQDLFRMLLMPLDIFQENVMQHQVGHEICYATGRLQVQDLHLLRHFHLWKVVKMQRIGWNKEMKVEI